jgi:hypothetical protein
MSGVIRKQEFDQSLVGRPPISRAKSARAKSSARTSSARAKSSARTSSARAKSAPSKISLRKKSASSSKPAAATASSSKPAAATASSSKPAAATASRRLRVSAPSFKPTAASRRLGAAMAAAATANSSSPAAAAAANSSSPAAAAAANSSSPAAATANSSSPAANSSSPAAATANSSSPAAAAAASNDEYENDFEVYKDIDEYVFMMKNEFKAIKKNPVTTIEVKINELIGFRKKLSNKMGAISKKKDFSTNEMLQTVKQNVIELKTNVTTQIKEYRGKKTNGNAASTRTGTQVQRKADAVKAASAKAMIRLEKKKAHNKLQANAKKTKEHKYNLNESERLDRIKSDYSQKITEFHESLNSGTHANTILSKLTDLVVSMNKHITTVNKLTTRDVDNNIIGTPMNIAYQYHILYIERLKNNISTLLDTINTQTASLTKKQRIVEIKKLLLQNNNN